MNHMYESFHLPNKLAICVWVTYICALSKHVAATYQILSKAINFILFLYLHYNGGDVNAMSDTVAIIESFITASSSV